MSKPNKLKILLIEDDKQLCEGWAELFELFDFDLQCHTSASSALSDPDAILTSDLLISDYYLPDLNGIELIKRIRSMNPGIPALLLTGSREKTIAESAGAISQCAIVYKPVNIDDLEMQILKITARA